MKKIVVFISFFLASLAGFSQIKDGFARSESGVWYKIETKNPKGRAVVEGDIVIEGQCIGQIPEKALGACVHSSINGRVVNISKDYIDIMEA